MIIITGGAGFIGSHLVEHLLRVDTLEVTELAEALAYDGTAATCCDINADGYNGFRIVGLASTDGVIEGLTMAKLILKSLACVSQQEHVAVEPVQL